MNRHSVEWKGYIPAITTPFADDGSLDRTATHRQLEWLHSEGMHGVIVAGTTGEWFSLTREERTEQLRIVGDAIRGQMTLIAGCNSYTAAEAIELAGAARQASFDGILLTPPPYIVPNDDEIYTFYKTVSDAVELPICVYNWPRGTSVDMSAELLSRLADLEKVVALKHSTGNIGHFLNVFYKLREKIRIFGFAMDELGITMVAKEGGDGTMGAGAVLGSDHPNFYNAIWRGDLDAARHHGARDRVIMAEWFNQDYSSRFGSPQSIFKAALNVQGLPGGRVRPPLLDLQERDLARIADTLGRLGRKLV
jgi:dihydrodipicolinate synthase/N-acetylneuraminate lyase